MKGEGRNLDDYRIQMGVKYSLRKCELTNPERKENCKVSDNIVD